MSEYNSVPTQAPHGFTFHFPVAAGEPPSRPAPARQGSPPPTSAAASAPSSLGPAPRSPPDPPQPDRPFRFGTPPLTSQSTFSFNPPAGKLFNFSAPAAESGSGPRPPIFRFNHSRQAEPPSQSVPTARTGAPSPSSPPQPPSAARPFAAQPSPAARTSRPAATPPPGPSSSSAAEEKPAELCADCAALDLETAFARAHDLYENARRGKVTRELVTCRAPTGQVYLRDFYFVASLGSRLSDAARTAGCKLCALFAAHVITSDAAIPAGAATDATTAASTISNIGTSNSSSSSSSSSSTTDATTAHKLLAICASESYLFQPPRKNARGQWMRRAGLDTPSSDGVRVEHNVFLAVVPETTGVPRTGVPLRWLERELPRGGMIFRLGAAEQAEEKSTAAAAARAARGRAVGAAADLRRARRWLSTCRRNHGGCCGPRKPDAVEEVRVFRVIDCAAQPPVVREGSWREKYVALSYVWGPGNEDWPRTITDAVHVTRALGERYLWVDRLCIDQSNDEEKSVLVARMDDIYAGAEFTIVNAAGEARTGLPGVLETPRTAQPRVTLDGTRAGEEAAAGGAPSRTTDDDYLELLNVPRAEYAKETEGHVMWLDLFRHGLNQSTKLDLDGLLAQGQSSTRAKQYGISLEELDFYESLAKQWSEPFDEVMERQKRMADAFGLTLSELIPYIIRKIADEADGALPAGFPILADESATPRLLWPNDFVVPPSKPITPLPRSLHPGRTTLVSTMADPRHTIRQSVYATRGWTYQEGVLSTRRLVFTPAQLYWECNAMAEHESLELPLQALHVPCRSGAGDDPPDHYRFADYMLAGVFQGDMHHSVPEVQYGFREGHVYEGSGAGVQAEIDEEIKRLDGHIRAFTGRRLTNEGDSLKAFLGVAARYAPAAERDGLALVHGMPVWTGTFADGVRPALRDTFAFSVSVWFHVSRPVARHAAMYIADCKRRPQFPSWSWIGWEGVAEFNGNNTLPTNSAPGPGEGGDVEDDDEDEEEEDDDDDDDEFVGDNAHIDFFMAMLTPEWTRSINRMWSAEMVLHSGDGRYSTLLDGRVPHLDEFAGGKNQDKQWLLTVKDPVVLKHLYLMDSSYGGWKRLMGKSVELHLSVPVTEAELMAGHKAGTYVSVLVFASMVPFVFNGCARFLILRRADGTDSRWERIGRLAVTIEEWTMDKYKNSADMVDDLPVRRLGRDITIC